LIAAKKRKSRKKYDHRKLWDSPSGFLLRFLRFFAANPFITRSHVRPALGLTSFRPGRSGQELLPAEESIVVMA